MNMRRSAIWITGRDDDRPVRQTAGDDIDIALLSRDLDRLDRNGGVLSDLIDIEPIRTMLHLCRGDGNDVGLGPTATGDVYELAGPELAACIVKGRLQLNRARRGVDRVVGGQKTPRSSSTWLLLS